MDNDSLSAFLLLVLILLYGSPLVISVFALWLLAKDLRAQKISKKRLFRDILLLLGAQVLLFVLLHIREELA